MNKNNRTEVGIIIFIFNLIIAIGIGLISFGIAVYINGLNIPSIVIPIGITLLSFAFSFVIEKHIGVKL